MRRFKMLEPRFPRHLKARILERYVYLYRLKKRSQNSKCKLIVGLTYCGLI